MKILQIIHTAYRATLEEQDDTVVWLTHAMANAGGEFDVLLSGNAVNYVIEGQQAEGLQIGDWRQTQPPRLTHDVAGLVDKGIDVFVDADDFDSLGLNHDARIAGTQAIGRHELGSLFEKYALIWRW